MAQMKTYNEDYLEASEYLRLVLPFLSEHKIPASPVNYQVGYDYIAGKNVALKEELVSLIEEPGEPTEESLMALYRKHVVQDEEALETVRQELNKIIASIQGGFNRSNETLAEYMQSLNGFSDALSGEEDFQKLVGEVEKVKQSTRSTEMDQRNLGSQVTEMMEEIDSLRKQLAQVREESLTDALTGLANRKAFDKAMEQIIGNEENVGSPFCVIISDIDHFKKFNDTFGHLVGDKVLQFVATMLKSCVKGKDTAARFGGEEFVLILPETGTEGAAVVAEQIRNTIWANRLRDKRKNEDYGKITISLGVAQYRQGEEIEDLLRRADEALYKAKENGRNRVEIAS